MQQTSVSLTILTLLILCVGGAGQRRRQDPCLPSRLVPCSPPEHPVLAAADMLQKGRCVLDWTWRAAEWTSVV